MRFFKDIYSHRDYAAICLRHVEKVMRVTGQDSLAISQTYHLSLSQP